MSGRDLLTGDKLSNADRIMGIVPGLGRLAGLRRGDKLGGVLDSLGEIHDFGSRRDGFFDALSGEADDPDADR